MQAREAFCPNPTLTSNLRWEIYQTGYDIPGGRTGSDVERAELMVEAKFDNQDDPFEDLTNNRDFLRKTDRARQTLGQVTSYATQPLLSFVRIFSVLLFRKSARFMRWERAGATVSEHIVRRFLQIFSGDLATPILSTEAMTRPSFHSNSQQI